MTSGIGLVSRSRVSPVYNQERENQGPDPDPLHRHQDDSWIRVELRPCLEGAEPRFRFCLHQRDFVAGATVIDNICAAVAINRRMVLLLSRAFLESHWWQAELQGSPL